MHIPLPAPVSDIWSTNRGYVVNEMLPAIKRLQSYKEEIANGVSHVIAGRPGDAWNVAGAMIFMYLSSAFYHVFLDLP